jgi:hypothetical protein
VDLSHESQLRSWQVRLFTPNCAKTAPQLAPQLAPFKKLRHGIGRQSSAPQLLELKFALLQAKANQMTVPPELFIFATVHLPYLLTFLDVPEQAHSKTTLGVNEMPQVELLRDLYASADGHLAQEHLAINEKLAALDPLRLTWRELVHQTIYQVVSTPTTNVLSIIRYQIDEVVSEQQRAAESQHRPEELNTRDKYRLIIRTIQTVHVLTSTPESVTMKEL